MQEDIVGFEHRVSFQLAAPEAVGLLLRKNGFAGAGDCRIHLGEICVNAPKTWRTVNSRGGLWFRFECAHATRFRRNLTTASIQDTQTRVQGSEFWPEILANWNRLAATCAAD